jgi:hypothetical protein
MRLVTFGILAALVGGGCALQTGDPGEPASTSTELTTPQATPRVHQATASASATAGSPDNPEPSPWFPVSPSGNAGIGNNDDSNGMNPEPSPWVPQAPVGGSGTGDPHSGSAGTTSGNSGGSTPNRPDHAGHL